jgi:hypothetical protein
MTDKGYWQEPRCWCPPTGNMNQLKPEEKKQRREVTTIRHLNERLIGRLTSWGCFKKRWSQNWYLQELCSHVAAKLTQLEVHFSPLT